MTDSNQARRQRNARMLAQLLSVEVVGALHDALDDSKVRGAYASLLARLSEIASGNAASIDEVRERVMQATADGIARQRGER
jgi:hypothetical protein